MKPLLVTDVTVDYPGRPKVLDRADLIVNEGEIVGLVGESGSGKSTFSLAVLGLLDFKGGRASGQAHFEGADLLTMRERDLRRIRGKRIGLVLQSPSSALNPMLRIGTHLKEAWVAHERGTDWKHAALPLLERVCLPTDDQFLRKRPREVSVGQAQRILLAMALLHRPALIIADEPTSALDVITQAEILKLLREINRNLGVAVLLISHDLIAVASICSRVAILEKGRIAECGPVRQIFQNPAHPYTRRLVDTLARPAWMHEPEALCA